MFDIPFFLLPPKLQQRMRDDRKALKLELRNKLREQPVQTFDPKMKWSPFMMLDGASWSAYFKPMFDTEAVEQGCCDEEKFALPTNRAGGWGYRNVILQAHHPLRCAVGNKRGYVAYDRDVVIPALFRGHPSEVWMSLTAFEFFSQRPGIEKAKGNVLMGGLGLGHQLREVAKRKSVTSITVIEREASMNEWFGRRICHEVSEEFGKPVRLLCDDAYDHALAFLKEKVGENSYDCILFDIWQGYGSARHDHKWAILSEAAKEMGIVAWAWGASGAPKHDRYEDVL